MAEKDYELYRNEADNKVYIKGSAIKKLGLTMPVADDAEVDIQDLLSAERSDSFNIEEAINTAKELLIDDVSSRIELVTNVLYSFGVKNEELEGATIEKPEETPEVGTEETPEVESEETPEVESEEIPEVESEEIPVEDPEETPEAEPEETPEVESSAKPTLKPESSEKIDKYKGKTHIHDRKDIRIGYNDNLRELASTVGFDYLLDAELLDILQDINNYVDEDKNITNKVEFDKLLKKYNKLFFDKLRDFIEKNKPEFLDRLLEIQDEYISVSMNRIDEARAILKKEKEDSHDVSSGSPESRESRTGRESDDGSGPKGGSSMTYTPRTTPGEGSGFTVGGSHTNTGPKSIGINSRDAAESAVNPNVIDGRGIIEQYESLSKSDESSVLDGVDDELKTYTKDPVSLLNTRAIELFGEESGREQVRIACEYSSLKSRIEILKKEYEQFESLGDDKEAKLVASQLEIETRKLYRYSAERKDGRTYREIANSTNSKIKALRSVYTKIQERDSTFKIEKLEEIFDSTPMSFENKKIENSEKVNELIREKHEIDRLKELLKRPGDKTVKKDLQKKLNSMISEHNGKYIRNYLFMTIDRVKGLPESQKQLFGSERDAKYSRLQRFDFESHSSFYSSVANIEGLDENLKNRRPIRREEEKIQKITDKTDATNTKLAKVMEEKKRTEELNEAKKKLDEAKKKLDAAKKDKVDAEIS